MTDMHGTSLHGLAMDQERKLTDQRIRNTVDKPTFILYVRPSQRLDTWFMNNTTTGVAR